MLAKYLKEKRESANLTQSSVAEKLGYQTPQFISNWERGISDPPIDYLDKISKMYNIPKSEAKRVFFEHKTKQYAEELQKRLGL